MVVTYIGHSGFLIEWENCYWLFDYYTGEIPALDYKKKLMIFSSHKHGDHFNPEIFRLDGRCSQVEYVLSSDIRIGKTLTDKFALSDELMSKLIMVQPHKEYLLQDLDQQQIRLNTLKSTDCGVAFLLEYAGITIYHAGDLNHWVWKEETKQSNNNMTANFNQEMSLLKDKPMDIAFAPMDPRQEEWYYLGFEKLLNTAKVRYAFPMHFWDKPKIIQQFKQERSAFLNDTAVIEVSNSGQSWTFDL